MDISEFTIQNVWWKGKSHINEDRHISSYLDKKYKWRPSKTLTASELAPGNIYTLRGPRQIGKTTHIKLIVKSLIEQGIIEKNIFYASCDMLTDNKELLLLVRTYLDFAEKTTAKYIFLDEISGIKDWQKAIKFLVDTGELENVCLVLTGSHTLDIKYGFERLPGRVGKKGKNYTLLPLTFREFVALLHPDISKKIRTAKKFQDIKSMAKIAMPYEKELKALFNKYLIVGGFPLVINEYCTEGKIPDYIFELYGQWVVGDIVKWGKQEKILKQILRTALIKQGTALSWDSFSKDAEIKSHKTVSSYVEDLENMFVFFVLYFIEPNKKIADYNKNKKIYFFDPFIHHIFNRLFYLKEFEISPELIESVAVMHFARFAQKNVPDAKLEDVAFYYKNKKETDIVLKISEKLCAVEVKYQNTIKTEDFASLRKFENGLLLSKTLFDLTGKYPSIPIHIALALMD